MSKHGKVVPMRREVRLLAGEAGCGLKGCDVTFTIDGIAGWPYFTMVGEGENRHRVRFCSLAHQRLFEEALTEENKQSVG